MADYFPVVSRAVAGLENNTGEARRAVYERARAAIVKQLRAIDPPLSEEDVSRERMSLEEAIRRVEADAAPARAAEPRPTPPVSRPEPVKLQPAQLAPARPSPMAGPKGEPYGAEAPKPAAPQLDAPQSDTPKPAAKPGQAQIATPKSTASPAAKPTKRSDGRPIIAAGSRPDGAQKKKGSGVAIPLIALAVVLAGSGLFIARDKLAGLFGRSTTEVAQQEQTAPAATQPTTTEPAPQDGKSGDRLPQDGVPAAAPPAEQPQQPEQQAAREEPAPAPVAPPVQEPSPPPSSQPGPLVAQRATLYEEGPNQQSGEALAGSVLWRTDSVAAGQGQPLETAIRGEIDIPARKLRATMTIRRNADATLPASHTIEIQFDLPPDFPNAGVANVPGVVMKADESARGATVAGLSVRVTSGFFLIGLSNLETERTVNEQLLRDRSWIDVPILYDNGRRAVLTLEKGTPGTQAFNDAFNSWRSGPAAAAQP